jgi:hypothetical protein
MKLRAIGGCHFAELTTLSLDVAQTLYTDVRAIDA